jgi:hypothetical protein
LILKSSATTRDCGASFQSKKFRTVSQRRHSGGRYRVSSQFHPFRLMGPSQRQRRRLPRCRWVHTVRTGYGVARRHAAGRRLERHAERGLARPTGGARWLFYHPSRVIRPNSCWSSRRRTCAAFGPNAGDGVIGRPLTGTSRVVAKCLLTASGHLTFRLTRLLDSQNSECRSEMSLDRRWS